MEVSEPHMERVNYTYLDVQLCEIGLSCLLVNGKLLVIPADHVSVLVDRYVGSALVIVGSKVTVGGAKPLIKAMLEGQVLGLVTKMPT